MTLADLIAPEAVLPSLNAKDKKQLLAELSARASEISGLQERDIFDALLQRERLGSTGLGQGVAIPHGKMPGLNRIVGLFARLAEPIDARDGLDRGALAIESLADDIRARLDEIGERDWARDYLELAQLDAFIHGELPAMMDGYEDLVEATIRDQEAKAG